MTDVSTLPAVGAVVAKRCICGAVAYHREVSTHPRYRVVGIQPNRWLPGTSDDDALLCGRAWLERLDTGRQHQTSMLRLRDQYVILSLPTEAVMVS